MSIAQLRGKPVIYRFYDEERTLLYVGQTTDFQRRLIEHAESRAWWPMVAEYAIQLATTRDEALVMESQAIRTEMPLFNVAGAHADARSRGNAYLKSRGNVNRRGWRPSYDAAMHVYTSRYGNTLPLRITLPLFIDTLRQSTDGPLS